MNEIEYTWHSTPQLWIAMREGYCGCHECKPPFGMGKTKEEAKARLLEWEADSSNGDGEEGNL
jgi:hypothetical protein